MFQILGNYLVHIWLPLRSIFSPEIMWNPVPPSTGVVIGMAVVVFLLLLAVILVLLLKR